MPRFGLRAEFGVAFPGDGEVSGHNVFLTIRTDRVQFFPVKAVPDRWHPRQDPGVPLEEIPPAVFSEVMRDVDLLVGVTSIGADPGWSPENPFQDYWRGFAFGDLTTFAENRKSILERLLPKLAIRDKCRLEGPFLVVRGDWHAYRIHLGARERDYGAGQPVFVHRDGTGRFSVERAVTFLRGSDAGDNPQ